MYTISMFKTFQPTKEEQNIKFENVFGQEIKIILLKGPFETENECIGT